MIVEPVAVDERDGVVTRTAIVRWGGGEHALRMHAPRDFADTTDDASGFLCATLLPAMRCGEDLHVRGPVSPRLLGRCEEIRALYRAWAPGVRDATIRAEPGPDRARGTSEVAFFSRGVDSIFTAARDRAGKRRLDALVFADRLEPRHDAVVRAGEIEHARAAARRLGLPLVVCETNLKDFTDPIVLDWEDMCGAGLASVAHGVAGGVRTAIISSTDNYVSIEPAGTSPLLDPLFSTERVRVEHSSAAFGRLGKVRWLADHRPDLVPELKVCFRENRNDNCGRCPKCLLTMACLHVCGALEAAAFPVGLDLDAISALRLLLLKHRADWAAIATVEDDQSNGSLREAARTALRASAVAAGAPSLGETSFGRRWINETLSLLLEGKPRAPVTAAE